LEKGQRGLILHIKLKQIRSELIRYLPKGSDEQVEDLYNICKDYYFTLPIADDEKNKIKNLEKEIFELKQNNIPASIESSEIIKNLRKEIFDLQEEIECLKGAPKKGRPRKVFIDGNTSNE
jgi:hypothetical protein